tara:strand:- start:1877 stop:3133 length:1257 start_codon:yes stop_codon:yes gene_type:complete
MNLLIKSATIIDKNSEFHNKSVDILIKNGIISDISEIIKNPKNYSEICFPNLHVSIGWFDYSVCAGEPGFEERDNLINTLKVASKSGFTSVGLQPNTFPITEKSTEIEYLKAIAENSNIDIYPIGALTKKFRGNELAELLEMKNAGAIGFGDYKKSIVNPNVLKLALLYSKDFNLPIFSFPLNKEISNNGVMNESKISTMIGLRGIPKISEEIQIMRDIKILEYTGGNLHIPYISTGNSVELIKRAKDKGLNISCSTCIHNLFFDDNNLVDFDTKFKVLPPLRNLSDIKELISGVKDGVIDLVTSDHNPLNIELKNVEFDNAEFGTIGLESFFGALNKIFPTKTTINILTNGKKIFGIEETSIKIGAKADMSLFNPINSYVFDDENILSMSKNSIFKGSSLKGKIYGTISNGKINVNE